MTPPRPEPVSPHGPEMAAYLKAHYDRESARSQEFRCQTWYADKRIQAQCIMQRGHLSPTHHNPKVKDWSDLD